MLLELVFHCLQHPGHLARHEIGHLVAARCFGVRVLSISVGFGPEVIGVTDSVRHALDVGSTAIRGLLKDER